MGIVEQRWKEFENLGEEKVRQNLALRVYGEDSKKLAAAWLEQRQMHATKSATRAAWVAAVAAIFAAVIAGIVAFWPQLAHS